MNKCKLHYFRSVGKFFVFFENEIVKRGRNVALAYNTVQVPIEILGSLFLTLIHFLFKYPHCCPAITFCQSTISFLVEKLKNSAIFVFVFINSYK